MSIVEPKQVYVVTSGSYSNYGIVGVFDDAELAKLAAKAVPDGNEVEIYDLNPDADKYRAGLTRFAVWIERNGTIKRASQAFCETRFVIGTRQDPEWSMYTSMWAKDEKHAIKIANERRSYLLAENLWPERSDIHHRHIRFPWEETNES